MSVIIENSASDAFNTSQEWNDANEECKEKYDDANLAQISFPSQNMSQFNRKVEYEDLFQYIEYELSSDI